MRIIEDLVAALALAVYMYCLELLVPIVAACRNRRRRTCNWFRGLKNEAWFTLIAIAFVTVAAFCCCGLRTRVLSKRWNAWVAVALSSVFGWQLVGID